MKHRYLISILIVIGMVVWVYSGQLFDSSAEASPEVQEEPDPETEASTPLVRGVFSQAHPHGRELVLQGRTEANRQVQVRAEVAGRVVELPVEKGAVVAEGDLLCRLAVDAREDAVKMAGAAMREAELKYQGVANLQSRGLQSQIILAEARTRLESARVSLRQAELDLANTRIPAPFAGVVQEQPVELGDYLATGGVCAGVLDPNPMLLVGQVAEKDVAHVAPGAMVRATLLDGYSTEGQISYVSLEGDSVTRAYRIEAEVANDDLDLRAGLTAEIRLSLGSSPAHLISPGVLVLNDQGLVGVRTVNGDDQVEFHAVRIIDEGMEGVWVVGLPNKVNIITVGQEEVFSGQEVRVDLTPLVSAAGV